MGRDGITIIGDKKCEKCGKIIDKGNICLECQKKEKEKIKTFIISAFILLILAGAFYQYMEYQKKLEKYEKQIQKLDEEKEKIEKKLKPLYKQEKELNFLEEKIKEKKEELKEIKNKAIQRRYIKYTDNTIRDLLTGLIWQKIDPLRKREWRYAVKYCQRLSLDHYSNWRLPSINELKSLHDYFLTKSENLDFSRFWSSINYNRSKALYINLKNNTFTKKYKSTRFHVLCVTEDQMICE